MGHAKVENLTPFSFETAVASDEDGHVVYVPIVKATYALEPDGSLVIVDQQLPVNFSGELWGEPGHLQLPVRAGICGLFKPTTDVVLIPAMRTPVVATTAPLQVPLSRGLLLKK